VFAHKVYSRKKATFYYDMGICDAVPITQKLKQCGITHVAAATLVLD